jgi:XTP/dITP diphosphohydrolase
MILYVCSTNRGKLREFALAAARTSDIDLRLEVLPGLEQIPAPDETGNTFEDNAVLKALYYSANTEPIVLAEDSGLEVDALGGNPGVYSARFAGIHANDASNNELLLTQMSGVSDRKARYVSVIALARSGSLLTTCRGEVEGEITLEPRGTGGFGYDPLFYFPPYKRTFAEVTPDEKLAVSHRGRAFEKLLQFLIR